MSIIKISNDLTVSSREVAEKFGKEHKNILQSIENLAAENSAVTVPQFAKKENMGENAVRRMINKRILPHPVHIVENGVNKINWAPFCEWLKVPENAKKLERL